MTRRYLAVATAALALAGTDLSAQTGAPLRFCAAQHNLPMSAAHPPSGIELEVAQAIGRRLDTQAEFVWRDADEEGLEQGVLEGRCDAALGVLAETGGMAGAPPAPGIARTRPYYGAGYVLIHHTSVPPVRALAELAGTRIAVEAESVPVYTLKQRGHPIHAFFDYDAVVEAVAEGRVKYGYLWGPVAARLLGNRNDVVIASGFEPEDRWNFAMAVRESDTELQEALNAAIRSLIHDGTIVRIFAGYGVPYLRPDSHIIQEGPHPGSAGERSDRTQNMP